MKKQNKTILAAAALLAGGYLLHKRKQSVSGVGLRKTYNVIFNDDYDSNDKGMRVTKRDAIDYVKTWNGTNHSYFANYKGGEVAVICNETGEIVYSEPVR